MAKFNWINITKEDVIKAIEKFVEYNPDYPEAQSTFLVYNGRKLPAKHIRGMAYQEHYGVSIRKSDFSGGKETVKFFERLGFEVDYRPGANDNGQQKNKTTNTSKNISNKTPQGQDKKTNSDKIIISSKDVIEQKNALQLILNRMFSGDIVCEKTYPWLKTPKQIEGIYKDLYEALVAYRGDTVFAKKGVALRCDFVCESQRLIIEYDERQHFSEARRISLESYKGLPVCFDRKLWIKACADIKAKDNSPYNRDEIRAFYDSVRDIACHEHGYKLVRIMHGQIDFEAADASEKLHKLLDTYLNEPTYSASKSEYVSDEKAPYINVAMYLQTNELKNQKEFEKIFPVLKNVDADIVVFPEYCYVPFVDEIINTDILVPEDQDRIFDECLNLSKEIGKAVIVSSHDKYDTIYSVFANAKPLKGETELNLYIKHTMCGSSCLEFEDYSDMAQYLFDPIIYKGYMIGMTICYDCNHALFSRMYGMYGIDLIINSTGGNVVYDKWFKYNKVRAIENECYTLVTMGGDGITANNNYVFGFNIYKIINTLYITISHTNFLPLINKWGSL